MPGMKQALILVDIQQGVVPPPEANLKRSTPDFETNISKLLAAYRSTPGADIIHVRHHSKHPGSQLHPSKPGVAVLDCAAELPSELVITKTASSGFAGTNLAEVIKSRGISRVVFCGLTVEHCVSTTVRWAADLDVVDHTYGVTDYAGPDGQSPKAGSIVIVSDASAMYENELFGKKFDVETAHDISLASIKGEFCDVESTAEVLANLQSAS